MPKQPKRRAPMFCYWRGDTIWLKKYINSKCFRESLHTSDYRVAQERAEKRIRALTGAILHGETHRIWEDVVAEWALHISRNVGAKTAARYANSLSIAHDWFTGKEISSISIEDCDAYATYRVNKGVTNATIRRDLTAISSVLKFAQMKRWRTGNPAIECALFLKERREPIHLPQEASYQAILSHASPEYRAVVEAARYTGARLDELRNAKRKNLQGTTLYLERTKGGRPRAIDLSPQALKAIQSAPVAIGSPNLFTLNGAPLNDITKAFIRIVARAQKAAQKAGREFHAFRFHDLRHWYAVEYLQAGGSIYDLQQQLGHSSLNVTEGYLKFLTPSEARRAKKGKKSA